MQLVHLEARPAVAHAIPEDAADQAIDVRGQARRSVQSAQRGLADARTQQPEKPGDMIDVRMGDEHVADLVGNARGQPCALTQVEQQAAPPVAQAYMQQWIAEHAVDEAHTEPAHPAGRSRPGHGRRGCMRRDIRRRQVGKPVCGKAFDCSKASIRVACGIAHKK